MVILSPETPAPAKSVFPSRASPIVKKGPTVCDVVAWNFISSLRRRSLAAVKNNVEAVPQRLIGNRAPPIKCRSQPVASLLIRSAIENWIVGNQRVSRKIHLRNQPRGERRPEQ